MQQVAARPVMPVGHLPANMQHVPVHHMQYHSPVMGAQGGAEQDDNVQIAQYHSQIQQHYAQQAASPYQQHYMLGHHSQGIRNNNTQYMAKKNYCEQFLVSFLAFLDGLSKSRLFFF